MEKINIGKNVFIYPMPVTLLGTMVEGKANFMALGWVTRINANPPLLALGVNKVHQSCRNIEENRAFSINFPNADMIVETDYCGLVSGEDIDKSNIFEVFYGELETAPMITSCSLNLECKLFHKYQLPTNKLFIGEIVGAYTEERYLTDGKPDISKMNPLLLTMPDNNYWNVGEPVGKAWNIGKKLKR
ncbi:MAG: flavin reductase family protein [Euryarchaeota archaeon]|nr:flavin reductase family protein [Euryarchaeota archaeon]